MKKFILKHSVILMIFLALAALGSLLVCQHVVRKNMIDDYNTVVGKMYAADKELAEKATEYLYSNKATEENLETGKQAMKEFGYTEQGMLFAKTFDIRPYQITAVVMVVLLFFMVLVVLWQKQNGTLKFQEEKQRLKENLLHSNQGELNQLEKRKAMTQTYVENVAHQVRTPLTNAMLNIALVYENQSEADKDILNECTYHIGRVNKLMERLLKIGWLEAGKVEFAKQKENLAELFEEMESHYPQDRVKLELQEVVLHFDYEWIYEAFSCLVENCLDHVGAECEVQITLTATEERAVVTVEDNGTGFKEEDIPYLFERFYSSEKLKATGHYGIGLNLAKLIVEQHYGKITAYNRASGGAGFRVELPRYKLK